MSFSSIVLAVLALASIVALAAFMVGRKVGALNASKAARAVHEASQRAKMLEAFEAACKRALLHDANVKAAEVRMGLRARTGTKLGIGAFKN
jgi:lipopolysaccharide export LptBFGC system permease protein LptF